MAKAKARGLWNLFPPRLGRGVDGRDGRADQPAVRRPVEIQGTSIHGEMAAQATNRTSPDTGNMETIARFGTAEQKERWLKLLLEGKIRSCFAMTEPDKRRATRRTPSTSKKTAPTMHQRAQVVHGRRLAHTQIMILMGKTDPTNASIHKQQSMLLVPMDTPASSGAPLASSATTRRGT